MATQRNGETLFSTAKLYGGNFSNLMILIPESELMTTSPQTSFLPESGGIIPPDKLGYLHARTSYKFYDFILRKFLRAAKDRNLTKADLARRIGKSPAVVNRLLASPGNWTLETLSTLLAGICAEEFTPSTILLSNRQPRNFAEPEWMLDRATTGSGTKTTGTGTITTGSGTKTTGTGTITTGSATITIQQFK